METTLAEQDIVLTPEELQFTVSDTEEQMVTIENWSEFHVAFRVRPSVSNVLVLGDAGGVVEASTAADLPLSAKKTTPPEFDAMDLIEVSLTLEFVPWTEEYEIDGVRAFWANKAKHALRKNVSCVVKRSSTSAVTPPAPTPTLAQAFSNRMDSAQFQSFDSFSGDDISDFIDASPATATAEMAIDSVPPLRSPSFLAEMKTAQESENLGLSQNDVFRASRRHSMPAMPGSDIVFDELKQKQMKLASGEFELKKVTTKTAAEKEQERLRALEVVPEGGFTSVLDELKHFSYMLSKSSEEAGTASSSTAKGDSDSAAVKQQQEALQKKDKRISELNEEIQRLLQQHEKDSAGMEEQMAARLAALVRQHESHAAMLASQQEDFVKNLKDEHNMKMNTLRQEYESKIDALTKQQGDDELLQQQTVMMEAFTRAKELEIRDITMHQEIKFGTTIQHLEATIDDLKRQLQELKEEKEAEVASLKERHAAKVKGLMSQQAVAISTLSAQLESTMALQHARVESLTKELGNLHQKRLSDLAAMRADHESRVKAYAEQCEKIAISQQRQIDELTAKLQKAELDRKAPVSATKIESVASPPQAFSASTNLTNPLLRAPSGVSESAVNPLIAKSTSSSSLRPQFGSSRQFTTRALGERPIGSSIAVTPARVPEAAQVPAVQQVLVTPAILQFQLGNFSREDSIFVKNQTSQPIAYKVRVNVKNMFSLPEPGGLVAPHSIKLISVSLKESSEFSTMESVLNAKPKFLVELVQADDGYNLLGAKVFWESKNPSDVVKKQVNASFE